MTEDPDWRPPTKWSNTHGGDRRTIYMTERIVETVKRMSQYGHSSREIAEKIGVSAQTVCKWQVELGTPRLRQGRNALVRADGTVRNDPPPPTAAELAEARRVVRGAAERAFTPDERRALETALRGR